MKTDSYFSRIAPWMCRWLLVGHTLLVCGCGTTIDFKCTSGVKSVTNKIEQPAGEVFCGLELKYPLVRVGLPSGRVRAAGGGP